MTCDAEHFKGADAAVAILKEIYVRTAPTRRCKSPST
jgi:hypothetical protein